MELDDKELAAIAIVVLGVLEAIAMFLGVDGAILSLVVAAIAGLAGYELKAYRGA